MMCVTAKIIILKWYSDKTKEAWKELRNILIIVDGVQKYAYKIHLKEFLPKQKLSRNSLCHQYH